MSDSDDDYDYGRGRGSGGRSGGRGGGNSRGNNRRNSSGSKISYRWIIGAVVAISILVAAGVILSKQSAKSKPSRTSSGKSTSSSTYGRRLNSAPAIPEYDDYENEERMSNPDEDIIFENKTRNGTEFTLFSFVPSSVGTCNTSACTNTVQEIVSSINSSINPCDNFYRFACDGWEANNPRPRRMGEWNVFAKLQNETYDIVRGILEEPIRKKDVKEPSSSSAGIPALNQAKRFYRSCKNADLVDSKMALKPMWDTLEKYGGWPILYGGSWDSSYGVGKKFSWMHSMVDLKRFFENSVLLEIISYQSLDGDLGKNAIVLKPAGRSSEKKNLFAPVTKETVMAMTTIFALQDLIVNVARELLAYKGDTTINKAYLENIAFDIILVQSEIGKLKKEAVDPEFLKSFGINSTSGMVRLDGLQKMLNHYVGIYGLQKNELQLPQLLGMLYGNAIPRVDIYSSEKVYVSDFHYLLRLAKFLSVLKPEALANFMHFNMAIQMSAKTTKRMREFLISFKSAVEGTVQEEQRRSLACVEETKDSFHHAVGQAYVRKRYPLVMDSVFDEIEIQFMFNDVKQTLYDLITKSSRVSFFYKHVLMTKVLYTTLCYGYPKWTSDNTKLQAYYAGLVINQATYLEQCMTVNSWATDRKLSLVRTPFDTENECTWDLFAGTVGAANQGSKFIVYLPLGILQPPFFSLDYPKVLNYGRLGTILGHELIHSLDGLGWTNYEDGSLTSTSECFVRQFDDFTTEELKDESVTVDGRMTLHENIPDSAGLLNAFIAFKSLSANNSDDGSTEIVTGKPLKGLEKYTHDQLFFLGFAQNFCESSTLESMIKSMTVAKHSPGMFRILGTLKNSKEFSQAWNCPVGSKMNPTSREYERCQIF